MRTQNSSPISVGNLPVFCCSLFEKAQFFSATGNEASRFFNNKVTVSPVGQVLQAYLILSFTWCLAHLIV